MGEATRIVAKFAFAGAVWRHCAVEPSGPTCCIGIPTVFSRAGELYALDGLLSDPK